MERHLARVDRVVRAVHQRDHDVQHRVAGDDPALERLADALLDGGDELARDTALGDLVLEDDAAAGLAWPHVDLGVTELALFAVLANEPPDPLRRPPDRFL